MDNETNGRIPRLGASSATEKRKELAKERRMKGWRVLKPMKGRRLRTSKQTRKREWTERRERKRRNPHRPTWISGQGSRQSTAHPGAILPRKASQARLDQLQGSSDNPTGGLVGGFGVLGGGEQRDTEQQPSGHTVHTTQYACAGRRYIAPCIGPRAPCRYQQLEAGRPLLETMIRRPDLSWCA